MRTGLEWGLDTGEAERERGAARPVRLNGLDAAMVELETDRTPLQMIAVLMLDTTTVPGGYEYARLRDFLATRIHVVPPCRRMLGAVPGSLHRAVWSEVGELVGRELGEQRDTGQQLRNVCHGFGAGSRSTPTSAARPSSSRCSSTARSLTAGMWSRQPRMPMSSESSRLSTVTLSARPS